MDCSVVASAAKLTRRHVPLYLVHIFSPSNVCFPPSFYPGDACRLSRSNETALRASQWGTRMHFHIPVRPTEWPAHALLLLVALGSGISAASPTARLAPRYGLSNIEKGFHSCFSDYPVLRSRAMSCQFRTDHHILDYPRIARHHSLHRLYRSMPTTRTPCPVGRPCQDSRCRVTKGRLDTMAKTRV